MQTYYVNEKPINVIASTGSAPINLQQKQLTITENKITPITPDDGYQGLSDVIVTTNIQPHLTELNDTIQYGTSESYPIPTGYDGFNSVTITANGPTYQSKSITIDHPQILVVEPTGVDFLDQVAINATYFDTEEKNVTVTQNGITEITPSSGKAAMTKVNLTVAVPTTQVTPNDEFYIQSVTKSGQNQYIGLNNGSTVLTEITNSLQMTGGTYIKFDSLGNVQKLYMSNQQPSLPMTDGGWYLITNDALQISYPPTGTLSIITTTGNIITLSLENGFNENLLELPQGYLTILNIIN